MHKYCDVCAKKHLKEVDNAQSQEWNKNNPDKTRQSKRRFIDTRSVDDVKLSGIKYISWDKVHRKWAVIPTVCGIQVKIGRFTELNDAKKALQKYIDTCKLIIKHNTIKMEENIMKKYEVIEDNGGGLTLAVFSKDGKVEYIHTGYEYVEGQLLEELEALKNGDNPAEDWDGNCGGMEWEYGTDPQAIYDDIISYEYGWEIVADNDGMYPDKMGLSASEELLKDKNV